MALPRVRDAPGERRRRRRRRGGRRYARRRETVLRAAEPAVQRPARRVPRGQGGRVQRAESRRDRDDPDEDRLP